ncbi:MAG TPA: glycerophosphodiester phosphodiesterase [Candidatus Limnocylindrales bacterium]|jgi:glycerophosphoryl diester phosphodiesterase|nr:glycerophosphodiester phosphodiesterase [Candidatus Limnocylindrales bacterium]
MLRIAHRGDWRRAPENTLGAIEAALAVAGCDGVEFDVRLSGDGVPVLIHDETLARVQGRPERVDEVPARALEDLGVPSLADVLAAIPHRAQLDVELKGRHDRVVVEILAAGRGPGLMNAVVSSFDPDTLERVGGLAPAWPRWLNAWDLSTGTIRRAAELGCRAISVDFHVIDRGSIAAARAAELEIAAFTVRRRDTFGRLQRLGVISACVEGAALDG